MKAVDYYGAALALCAQKISVFPVDHPDNPNCIGLHVTTPCDGSRGKHPCVAWGSWRATTPQIIESAWSKRDGLANIGIHCGASGLVILDEDQHGELDRWCRDNKLKLPETYEVDTGRGRHLYFRWDHTKCSIGNSSKALDGYKIDVRGDGGFAVAAGSKHATAVVYVGNGKTIAPLPQEVADKLLAGAPAAPDAGAFFDPHTGGDPNATMIGDGERHPKLIEYAGRLRNAGLDYFEAEAAFRARWLLCEQPDGQIPEAQFHSPGCRWPVTWDEAKAKLRDVFMRYAAGLAAVPLFTDNGSKPKSAMNAMDEILAAESGFWDARATLRTVYDVALSRMCAPWAVLACCAARALTIVRPTATLPALIGGRGSLNWFAAIVAPSGGGKGSAMAVARDLVPEFVYQRNLGSGEGVVTAYQTKANAQYPDGKREAVMFVADEIDNMTALGSRTGSTLMGTLRSAFSGETVGFSYATKGRDIHLPAHTYRLTLVCAIQPGRAATLLGDSAGGTPQRFMWFPGMDTRVTRNTSGSFFVPTLTMPNLSEWLYPREIFLPKSAEDTILDQRVNAMHGKAEPLDAHAIFAREKFAFALAVLDDRIAVSQEDWDLAGIASQVSTIVRRQTVDVVREASRLEASDRGALRGVEQESADIEKDYQKAERTRRVLRWVLDKLEAAGADGMTAGELVRKAASRDRALVGAALNLAVRDGLVKQSGDKWVKL